MAHFYFFLSFKINFFFFEILPRDLNSKKNLRLNHFQINHCSSFLMGDGADAKDGTKTKDKDVINTGKDADKEDINGRSKADKDKDDAGKGKDKEKSKTKGKDKVGQTMQEKVTYRRVAFLGIRHPFPYSLTDSLLLP